MANEWEVSRTTGSCAATGRELAEGEAYYAVLFETAEGFERKDFTIDSWTGPPPDSFCYWRARVPIREKKSGPIAVDLALLTNFFLRLEEEDAPVKQQFRFVLTLLLMRKRLLKLDKTIQEGGREYWQVRLVREQSEYKILNPHLSDEEVEQLSAQLSAILSGDAEAFESLSQQNQETLNDDTDDDNTEETVLDND